MPNRILFLVSAMLASLALPMIPSAARAADDCLANPDTATPSGGHWRYHIERGTGRKCWYLADESPKESSRADAAKDGGAKGDAASNADDPDVADSAPPKPAMKITPSLERAAAAPPDRPRVAKPMSPAVAQAPANNARAEFVDPPQPAPAAPAQAAAPQPAAPVAMPQSAIGTRWPSPGPVGAAESGSALTTAAAPAAASQPAPDTPAAPVVQAVAPAPADPSPTAAAANGPDYLLYALIAAVIGFTVVVGYAGLRFLADWWRDWRAEARWRRSLQPSIATRGPSMMAVGEVSMELTAARRSRTAESIVPEEPPRRLEDEIDEIEQLLALTRQAANQSNMSQSNMSWETHAPRDAAE
jgi:hypothetical protein